MAKLRPLESIPNLTKDNWQDVGDKSANEMREQVVKKKFFRNVPYTEVYRKRKQARKAARKGVSVSSTSGVPDLTLTGKLMQALRTLRSTSKGAWIGWTGNLAAIVEGNANNKRDLEDQKLLDKVSVASRKQVEKFINKNIVKTKGTIKAPINIRL